MRIQLPKAVRYTIAPFPQKIFPFGTLTLLCSTASRLLRTRRCRAGEWRAVKDVSIELSESMLLSHRVAAVSRRTLLLRLAHAAHTLRRSVRRLLSRIILACIGRHGAGRSPASGGEAAGGAGGEHEGATRRLRVRRTQVAAAHFLSEAHSASSSSLLHPGAGQPAGPGAANMKLLLVGQHRPAAGELALKRDDGASQPAEERPAAAGQDGRVSPDAAQEATIETSRGSGRTAVADPFDAAGPPAGLDSVVQFQPTSPLEALAR